MDLDLINELNKEIDRLQTQADKLLGRAEYSKYMSDYHKEIHRTSMRQYHSLIGEIKEIRYKMSK